MYRDKHLSKNNHKLLLRDFLILIEIVADDFGKSDNCEDLEILAG